MTAFFRPAPGGVEFTFGEELAEWLSELPDVLEGVREGSGDPAAERLQVPVYLDDAEANSEWWRWMGEELASSRAADRSAFRELVQAAISGTVASLEEAQAFLRVLVEGRLALAARLGVEVEEDYARLRRPEAVLLSALAELQVMLIRALPD